MVLKKIGLFDDDNSRCPKCGSSDLEYGAYEPVDESFKQEITCVSCEAYFVLYCMKPRYWEIWADEEFWHLKIKNEKKE